MTTDASLSAIAASILIVDDAVANRELLSAGSGKAPPFERRRRRCVSPTAPLYSRWLVAPCLAPP